MTSARSPSTQLAESLAQAQSLAALLEQEREILLRGDGAALQELSQQKHAALESLEASVRANSDGQELDAEFRQQLEHLQKANQQNGALLGVRQSYARWALDQLRGDLAVPAYQPTGMNAERSSARSLGRA